MGTLFIALAIIVALFAGYALGKIHTEFQHMRERITTLEHAQVKHLPYKSMEAIEDFEAAVLYTEQAFEIAQLHLQHTHELGKIARNPNGVK
jgi:hypothetical protein